MKTKINTEYLNKIEMLAHDFAVERTKLFLPESYDKVYSSAYDVYYSIGVFLYIKLYKRSPNPNDFNFNRIHSGLLKRFSCKLYHKIVLDLEKNEIIRVNNHYNWIAEKNNVKIPTFSKSFMLSSNVIRMIHQAEAKMTEDSLIYVPNRILKLFPMNEEVDSNVQNNADHRLNRILKETKEEHVSTVNFYNELKFDEKSLVDFCNKDDILEYFLRKDLKRLNEMPKFVKGRWYHVFHNFSKKFREKVLRLDDHNLKEIFDVSCSDLHMLAKILENEKDIPIFELRKFQLDVIDDFRKKFGVRKDGRCTAKVKKSFKVYLNSKESFYWSIRGNSICKRIDEYFKEKFPHIRDYIIHKNEIWIDIMNEEFKCISDRLVKRLYNDYNVKALTCHDSIWIRDDQNVVDIKKMFYDELGLMAYNEIKLNEL